MFVTRCHLDRRTFLRGAGAALALPLLDAMTPAFSRDKTDTPRRFVAMCATLGFHTPFLVPEDTGRDYKLTPYLEALKEHRKDLTVFSGLSHPEQNGANGHSSHLTWLTAARRPELPGFKNSVSLDQLIAEKLGIRTRFPSLVLCTHPGDSLSWTSNGVQIPSESMPSRLFAQMFVTGTPTEVAAQVRSLKRGRSILDTVASEAKKLDRTLGPKDREKLDEYMTSVRGLETRIRESENWVTKPKPKVDAKMPTDVQNRNDAIARIRLLNEMVVLALQTDSTRTVTLKIQGLNAVPVVEGVSNDWHNLSHHGQDAAKIDELKKIELAEFAALAGFLSKLKSIKEAGSTLLERTSVLYGSNLGNASSHDWRNLPIVVAGGGFKHGQHLAFDRKNNTAFSNLFVTLAQRMGVEVDKFGTSTAAGVKGFEA